MVSRIPKDWDGKPINPDMRKRDPDVMHANAIMKNRKASNYTKRVEHDMKIHRHGQPVTWPKLSSYRDPKTNSYHDQENALNPDSIFRSIKHENKWKKDLESPKLSTRLKAKYNLWNRSDNEENAINTWRDETKKYHTKLSDKAYAKKINSPAYKKKQAEAAKSLSKIAAAAQRRQEAKNRR